MHSGSEKNFTHIFGKLKIITQSLHCHSQRRRHCFIQNEARDGLFDPLATNFKSRVCGVGKPVPISDSDKLSGEYKMEAMKKPNPLEEDLEEALNTVSELRKQLQEVNLLNAKLLYVNKVFKANNLTEGQKVNVIAAFDKAETVKEVKLVFETVSKNVVPKQAVKSPIKEHRSFASKPAGTSPKQVIVEESEAVKRMQILAGIKQREF
jgi:hypothetical protein